MARVAVTSGKIGSFSLKFLSVMYYTQFDVGELLLSTVEKANGKLGKKSL